MSWRERYNEIASFRGVEFRIEGQNQPVGRRIQVHSYPLRDEAYAEDLGRVPREFTLQALVIGPDYDLQRDRLIDACNAAGPGTLVHPYFGDLLVLCKPGRQTESSREGGLARFDLTFALWSPLAYPRAVADTRPAVILGADAAKSAAKEDFASTWDVTALPAFVAANGQALVEKAVGVVEDQVARVIGDPEKIAEQLRSTRTLMAQVATLIRDPSQLADELEESVRAATELDDAIEESSRFARSLQTFGDDLVQGPTPTATRQAEAANQAALVGLMRRVGAIEVVRLSTQIELESRDDAMIVRDRITAQLEDGIQEAGDNHDDRAFAALRDLQAQAVRDLDARGARLPSVVSVTPPASLPALVLAYRYHGDTAREEEIVERNGIDHPGFVPGGVRLEILTDV